MMNQEDATERHPIAFCDPAAVSSGVILFDKVGHHARRQRLVGLIPSVFLRVENALTIHHPAHVSGTMIAQDEWRVLWGRTQSLVDPVHGVKEIRQLGWWNTFEDRSRLPVRALIQIRKVI